MRASAKRLNGSGPGRSQRGRRCWPQVFPSEVRDSLRRSWVVMAPDYAPDPVQAILDAWLDAPPNADQSREQILALAAALEREGRLDEAQEVRAVAA